MMSLKPKLQRSLAFIFGAMALLLIWTIGVYGLLLIQSYFDRHLSIVPTRVFLLCLVFGLGLVAAYKALKRIGELDHLTRETSRPVKKGMLLVFVFILAVVVNFFLIRHSSVPTTVIVNGVLLLIYGLLLRFAPSYLQHHRKRLFSELRNDLRRVKKESKA